MLIDSHAHLEMNDFDDDIDEVIARAKKSGIGYIVTVGVNLEDSERAVLIADRYDMVYAVVGIHPHDAESINEKTYDSIKKLAKRNKVVAYGEIGLDFFRNLSPASIQIKRFEEQLDIASELGLPVVIHNREAHKETLEILTRHGKNTRGVIHCFSGDYAMAVKCIDLGFYISVPGTVTFKKSERLREVVKKVPLENLVVETDAPFLSPEPKRGKRNEPANVVYTAAKVAAIKGVSLEEVAEITSANAMELFGINKKV
jgi:TatD DNase family protein